LMDSGATAPVFLNTLLMQTTANRKLLQDIKEGCNETEPEPPPRTLPPNA
jgi:hypothetical protein